MSKRLYIIFVGMSLFLLLLVGCSNTQTTSNGYSNTENEEHLPVSMSIQKLTEDSINERYEEANDICFEDYEVIDNVSYLAFSYKNSKSAYYGFTVAEQDGEQWKLSYFEEDYPNEQKKPVMITQFIGTYPDTEDREFHITSGYVNDEQIKQVILYYPKSNVKIIQLGEDQHGFLDINIKSKDSLLKIECKSSKGKIIFQKNFDKS